MTPDMKELLRLLPSVTALLEQEEVTEWLNGLPRSTVVASLQAALNEAREAILMRRGTPKPGDVISVTTRMCETPMKKKR